MARRRGLCLKEGQLKLIDDFIQRLRLTAEPMSAQIGKLQLEFFDQ